MQNVSYGNKGHEMSNLLGKKKKNKILFIVLSFKIIVTNLLACSESLNVKVGAYSHVPYRLSHGESVFV